ncbi:MAG: DUF547 domain-containing protein [Candidatus Omnitrophica bacterium]|nr:DUF547 domain-containing protein [Candidatus Omnitrophota bacterium]
MMSNPRYKKSKYALKRLTVFFIFLIAARSATAFGANRFDHSIFDQILKKNVNELGQVDYVSAASDREALDEYLDQIHSINMEEFDVSWPREERLALWLNLYHAAILKSILDFYPVKSINDIPAVWTNRTVYVGIKNYSLSDIRLNQLMKVYRDEKILLVLSDGTVSAPPFPREAYTGPRVEGQMYRAATDFVNNTHFVQINPEKHSVKISKIFKWYEDDFILDFGRPLPKGYKFNDKQMAVLSFIANYLKDASLINFLEDLDFKIKYLPFDWQLNEWYSEASGSQSV